MVGTKAKNFRDLRIWQLGKEIVVDVYTVTAKFPASERFGLTNQLRRGAVSIPSNIAEGFNRFHNREYRQFLFIALGSCGELETQLELAVELSMLTKTLAASLLEKLDHESRMIRKLIATLA